MRRRAWAVAAVTGLLAALAPPGTAGAAQEAAQASSPDPGRLSLSLRGPAGEPVRGATVEAIRLGGVTGAAERHAGHEGREGPRARVAILPEAGPGRYRSPPLPAGRYRMRARAAGYEPWERIVALAPGAAVAIGGRLLPLPLALGELVVRAWVDPDPVPPGHAVDRVRFGRDGTTAATLGEWLEWLPGVSVRRRGAGGRQVLSVRGSRPEGVLVLLDGVPLNDPLSGAADLSTVPVATLESATLVRGALPEAGPGALGGVLLLRSRGVEGAAFTAGMEAGSFGRVASDVHAGLAGEAGSLAVTGRYEESRNDYAFRNRIHPDRPMERRTNADSRAWHGALTAQAESLPLAVRARLDRVSRGAPGRMGTRLFDEARREETAWQVALEAGDGSRATGGLAARFRSMRYRDPRLDVESRNTAADVRLHARFWPDAAGRWEATARLALEEAGGERLDAVPARPSAGVTLARRIGAAKLELRPALAADVARGGAALAPSLALAVRPGAGWRGWARAGRAFRLPTFSDLYFASVWRLRPNPDLRPERVRLDAEVGAEWTGPALRVRGAAYARLTDQGIVWLPSSVGVWSPRNVDRLAARGVELDLTLAPGAAWRIEGSAGARRSRLGSDEDGVPLPYLPAVEGGVAIERRGGPGALRAELRAVGPRTTGLAGTHRLPGFSMLDLAARAGARPWGVPIEVRVEVGNALGARYELVSLFPEPGRSLEMRLTVGPVPGG